METNAFTDGVEYRRCLPSENKIRPFLSEEPPGQSTAAIAHKEKETLEKRSKGCIRKQKITPLIEQTTFRSVLGQFSSGVTIVTTNHEGTYHGLTVSSFCSLSLTPPLVLVCIDNRSQSHTLIEKAEAFAVNILAENSEWLAHRFAKPATNKFIDVPIHLGLAGMPLLDDALATIECNLKDLVPEGDHSIFVGEVTAAKANDNVRPLLYHKSCFHQLLKSSSEI